MTGVETDAVRVKLPGLDPVPPAVRIVMGPVTFPAGTVAVTTVPEVTLNAAGTPLNATPTVVFRLMPEIVTSVPAGPLAGLKEMIDGGVFTAWKIFGASKMPAPASRSPAPGLVISTAPPRSAAPTWAGVSVGR